MDVLVLIDKLDDLIHNARSVPLTDSVMIDREEIYDLLDQMRSTIPEEIKQARWIVKERQEMLAEAKPRPSASSPRPRATRSSMASQEEVVRPPNARPTTSSRTRASASARSGSGPRTTPTRSWATSR